MYTQKKMINEAVRICKKHCPRLLSDVIDAYGTLSSGAQTVDDLIDAARVYEETGNFSKAVFYAMAKTYGYLTPNLWEKTETPEKRGTLERWACQPTGVSQWQPKCTRTGTTQGAPAHGW